VDNAKRGADAVAELVMQKNQPYLFRDPSGREGLLYCGAEAPVTLVFGNPYSLLPWKIWISQDGDRELATPRSHPQHGQVILECNPHLQVQGGQVLLRYIAGFNKGPNTPIVYRFCSLQTDWATEQVGEWEVGEAGFSAAWIEGAFYKVKKTSAGDHLLRDGVNLGAVFGFQNIYRVCPVHEEARFIITGDRGGVARSYLCSPDLSESEEIKNLAGESVYKCTLLGDRLVYTVKSEGEPRSLRDESYERLG